MEDGLLDKDEVVVFIKGVLLKIENVEKLMAHNPVCHIPAYNKILGIIQKFDGLTPEQKQQFFPYIVMTRGVASLFLNGKYDNGLKQIMSIKEAIIKIAIRIEREKNERDSKQSI